MTLAEGISAAATAAGVHALEHPARLGWLLPLAVAALVLAARRRPGRIDWPGWAEALVAGGRRLDALRAVSLALRGAVLVLLALVLAGPVSVHRAPPRPGHGLDLVLVVDTSGSMRALDAQGGEGGHAARTRLALAREVVSRFTHRRVAEGDRVGLVVFGDTAFTQCPLTSDGALLGAALERVEVGVAGEATALGDALALAVKRAAGVAADGGARARAARRGGAERRGAGRVVVLLTDGRSNAGTVPVDVAIELARGEGIRVHTVGIGTAGEKVPMAVEGAVGRGLRFERHDLDPATLERIASRTGGRAFRARRSSDLEAVYAEIDALERVERSQPARVRRAPRPEPLLAAAGGLLGLELALARVLRRRLP